MTSREERSKKLRDIGLVPTIQRLAVLEALEGSRDHPTADEIHGTVRKQFPSISRATVYNTLDALTRAGMILRLTVDPAAVRYDAFVGPHAHFRCRVCGTVYDIDLRNGRPIDPEADGHKVESIRTYAFGVCAQCLKDEKNEAEGRHPTATQRRASRKRSSANPKDPRHGG